MFDTIIQANSPSDIAIRSAIDTALNLKAGTVTNADVKALMTTSKVTISGREVSMTGQKFGLCAYGDCTNPGVTLELGKLSMAPIAGKP